MNNLNIYADAKIDGGSYDHIRIFGSADITGELSAKSMNVFGSCDFRGKCSIDSVKILGDCDFNGVLEADDLDIKGSCDFNEDVTAKTVKIFGSVKFIKNLSKAADISIFGDVDAKSLEADKISVKGHVNCSEQLNAENIEIASQSGSSIKEMVGTVIRVKPENRWFLPRRNKSVDVENIEGDDIYLEQVHAKTVHGKKVVIGPDCIIDLIEYSDSCEVSDKSHVGNSVKI